MSVQTLDGALHASQLGVTAFREHLVFALPGWRNSPEADELLGPEHVERMVRDLRAFRAAGGRTLVDAGGALLGREPRLFAEIGRAADVQIVASTGFWEADTFSPHYRLARGRVLEDYARLMHDDVLIGLACEDQMRAAARAGLIVVGASGSEPATVEELVCRAAGFVAKLTGVPVLLNEAARSERQLQLLSDQRVPLERVVVGHCDDAAWLETNRVAGVAEKGVFIALDHVGWQDRSAGGLPDAERVRVVKALVERGLSERILLSCSSRGRAIAFDDAPVGPDRLLRFAELMREGGISEDAVETILVRNPARLLDVPRIEPSSSSPRP